MDGWYSQPNDSYTQCVDGRQVTVRYCQSEWHSAPGGNHYTIQCMFCTRSCTCEPECTADGDNEQYHKDRKWSRVVIVGFTSIKYSESL